MNKTKTNNNPGMKPNSLIIKPETHAPVSPKKFVDSFTETTPQP